MFACYGGFEITCRLCAVQKGYLLLADIGGVCLVSWWGCREEGVRAWASGRVRVTE